MSSVFRAKFRRGQCRFDGDTQACFGTSGGADVVDASAYGRWEWDGKRLVAEVDQYGLYPLFYSVQDGWVAISNSLVDLLEAGVSTRLDYPGLSVFLRLGFFIGEDTPFREIKVLPPGGKLVWEHGKATVTGGYPVWGQSQDLSQEQAAEGYFEFFRSAVRRVSPGSKRVTLPLSGGLDSRHILLELISQGRAPYGLVTADLYPSRSGEDYRIAPLLAQATRLPITLLSRSDAWFDSELRKNPAVHFLADEHAWYLRLSDYLKEQAEVVFDGLCGDALGGSRFLTRERLTQMREERYDDFINDITFFGEPAMKLLLCEKIYKKMNHEVAVCRLTEELKRHSDAPCPVDSFFFWNRTRREMALVPACLYENVGVVKMPFMDKDLVDFRMSLSGESLLEMEGSYRKLAITERYPEFAYIPFENKKAPPRDIQQHFAGFSQRLAMYCLGSKSWLMSDYKLKPRLMRSLVDSSYASGTGWFAPMALYLKQLEEIVA